jgi:hypothetical protein
MRLSVLRRCCAQLPMPVAPNCAQMRPNQESKGSGFNKLVGAGDGNRTHVRSLGSFYSAIELRPPAASTQRRIASTSTGTQEMRGLCISKTPSCYHSYFRPEHLRDGCWSVSRKEGQRPVGEHRLAQLLCPQSTRAHSFSKAKRPSSATAAK